VTDADLVPVETLWQWVEQMVGFGPRLTGSDAHRRYLDFLHDRLASFGLAVTRYPTPLYAWQARAWALRAVDSDGLTHTVPVAFYRPHSGETPPRGVTATVVDVHAGGAADYQGRNVQGRIVLADHTAARLPATALGNLAYYVHPPGVAGALAREDYTRLWLGIPSPPSLELARQHGALAMISVLDASTPLAAGQFTPHQQVYAGLPALHVDRAEGAHLRALMKRGPITATVVLDAVHRHTTVDYIGAELKGSGAPGAVAVMTHTDGQNAIEENGGPAILALAEYFTRFARVHRPRDIHFLFSPNHMISPAATVKPDAWLKQHPDIAERLAMALVPEHLGTTAWDDDPRTGRYGPTGRSELAVVAVAHSDALKQLAISEVKASNLTRTGVLPPLRGGLYGEGTFAYRLGLPVVAFITGPGYLLQVERGDDLDKLDRGLMHRQTGFLARVLSRMLALPRA
jgi:hypothetical protein